MIYSNQGKQVGTGLANDVNNNVKAYILLNIDLLAILLPVIMILWLQIGLTVNQILILQGIYILVNSCFQIPSGVLSDTGNRKSVIIIGQGLIIASFFWYLFANDFILCLLAEILLGMGHATSTNSLEALIYDSLLADGRDEEYQATVRKERIVYFLSGILFAAVGGLLGSIAIRLSILVVTGIESIILLATISLLSDIQVHNSKSTSNRVIKAMNSFKNPVLINSTFFTLFAGAIGSIVYWEYQNILVTHQKFTPFMMGILMSCLNLLAAISSVISKKLENGDLGLLVIFVVLDALAIFLIVVWFKSLLILVPIILLQINYGSRGPIISGLIQENLDSAERATFISLNSVLSAIAYLVLISVINVFGLGEKMILHLMALLSAIIVICMIVVARVAVLRNSYSYSQL